MDTNNKKTKPQKWHYISNQDLPNKSLLMQPVENKGRYFYDQEEFDTFGLHAKEARRLFFYTQFKRLMRLFSKQEKWQYFLEEDRKNIDQAYCHHKPPPFSIPPIAQHIGHSTQLIQWEGLNLLIDPVFGDLNYLLYPRKTKPGLQIHELPKIDVILISHNHYDHCDVPSLRQLVPDQPIVIVPKGDAQLLLNLGFREVIEQSWWQCATVRLESDSEKEFRFYSTPVKHWSGRFQFDTNRSLFLG